MICKCNKEFKPTKFGKGAAMCSNCVTNRRRFELKLRCVEYLGGKCQRCEYHKCFDSLDFHHIVPGTKKFAISGNHCLSWDNIREELDKCELLCANCHREHHSLNFAHTRFEEECIQPPEQPQRICRVCSKTFSSKKGRKTCSRRCANLSQNRIDWPSIDELSEMVVATSFVSVGKQLGVSDNAIRHKLLISGIDPKSLRSIKDNGVKR